MSNFAKIEVPVEHYFTKNETVRYIDFDLDNSSHAVLHIYNKENHAERTIESFKPRQIHQWLVEYNGGLAGMYWDRLLTIGHTPHTKAEAELLNYWLGLSFKG